MKLRNRHGALCPANVTSKGCDGIAVIERAEGHELAFDDGTVLTDVADVNGSYVINIRRRLQDHLKTVLGHEDYTWRTLTALCIATGLSGDELERDYLPAVKARRARDTDRCLYGLVSRVDD